MYEGIEVISNFDKWNEWYSKEKSVKLSDLSYGPGQFFYPNMGVVLKNEENEFVSKAKDHGIVKGDKIVQLTKFFPSGIRPLNTEQTIALELLRDDTIPLVNLFGNAGCHRKGEKVLMFDGTTKEVQDVVVGDELIGPDSTPRKVLRLFRGKDSMYEVSPIKGNSYFVNGNHILYILNNNKNRDILEITVNDYIKKYGKKSTRNHIILNSECVNFKRKEVLIDPYMLGVWLGDGTSSSPEVTNIDEEVILEMNEYAVSKNLTLKLKKNVNRAPTYRIGLGHKRKSGESNIFLDYLKSYCLIRNKHIPKDYLINDENVRLNLLAGLIDTDGHLAGGYYEIIQKNNQLAEDIVFLAKSLGFACYTKKCIKGSQNGTYGAYNRISILGHIDRIPVKIPRKKANKRGQIKNVLHRGFSLNRVSDSEDYFGFMLDKDHLYLDDDFNVLHNSGKTLLACAYATHCLKKGTANKIVIAKSLTPVGKDVGYLKGTLEEKTLPWLGPFFDNFEKCDMPKFYMEKMISEGKIEISPITFIQGRSISNSVIIVDEIQNLEMDIIKQIITRAAENCKILLLGDPSQRFERGKLDLESYVEKCAVSELVGHIFFRKSVRSPLASWAANNL